MAPKDYVARDPVPRKKSSGAKGTGSAKRTSKTTRNTAASGNQAGGSRSRGATAKAGGSSNHSGARKNASEAHGNAVPKLRIAFTLAVLLGFGVFLWNIKDSSDNRRAEAQDTVASQQQAAEKQDDLPEMPKEEWEFMTTLTDPEYEVPVEMPEPIEESDKEYVMQCGSFRKMDQAESMRAKIAFQGLESQIKESNGNNGRWYRVVMGPYDRKRAAEKDRHALQRAGFTTCRIW